MRKNKFNATKVKIIFDDGSSIIFDSKLEASVYFYLKNILKVKSLVHHPGTIFLTDARIQYRPDFSFKENNVLCFAEAKGFATDTWKLKKRLWKFYGPADLLIFGGRSTKVILKETIKLKKKQKK